MKCDADARICICGCNRALRHLFNGKPKAKFPSSDTAYGSPLNETSAAYGSPFDEASAACLAAPSVIEWHR